MASGPRAIENFLDVTHFPFVHTGLLGDPNYPEVNDYQVEITPEGVTARDITVWQPDPDGSGQGAHVTYTYKVLRPLTAYFVKSSAGPRFAMYFTVTPVSPRRVSIAWTYVGAGLWRPDRRGDTRLRGQDHLAGHPRRRVAAPGTAAARPPGGVAPALGSHRRRLSHLAAPAWPQLRHGITHY